MPVKESATIAFLGDLMLGGRVSEMLATRSPDWIWGDVLPVLQQADAVLASLEGPITTHREQWRKTWKFFHFRADPAAIEILRVAGLTPVCVANFQAGPDAAMHIAAMKKVNSWEQGSYVQKAGWADMPGEVRVSPGLARACAEAIGRIEL